jgi:3-oxoacyl-[acyl-carrier-protein] synthase-1
MRSVFGKDLPRISATKAISGHSLGAAGVHEAIYSLLMMQNDFIAPSAHIEELDPIFADVPIVRERIDNAGLNTIMSNGFGFGGTNATLVFRRYNG